MFDIATENVSFSFVVTHFEFVESSVKQWPMLRVTNWRPQTC